MSLTWESTGSAAIADRTGAQVVTIAEVRASVDARSKRKPSTCRSVTQYRSEDRINSTMRGDSALIALPHPVGLSYMPPSSIQYVSAFAEPFHASVGPRWSPSAVWL